MALAEIFEAIAGPDAPVEFQAYDGSRAGVPGSPVKITVRSPVAVSYLAQAPGALGLARAYVSGHLDVDGNMFLALSRLSKAQDSNVGWGDRIKLLQDLGGPKVLGPSMAYTCACYPTADATLEEAQEYKHDLVARKIGLKPGMRLLDVGCGWGGMVRHAAKHYGVQALGVTLSRKQAEWAAKAIAEDGLTSTAE